MINENLNNLYTEKLENEKRAKNEKKRKSNFSENDKDNRKNSSFNFKHNQKDNFDNFNKYTFLNGKFLLKHLNTSYLKNNYSEQFKTYYNNDLKNIEIKDNSYFIQLKSMNIENIHRSIKYGVWSSTTQFNKNLNALFNESSKFGGAVYLFFSTNSAFCYHGIAKMTSGLQNYNYHFWVGSDKFKKFTGSFKIEWIVIKDVPNNVLDKITVFQENQNVPVSKLRNGNAIGKEESLEIIKIITNFFYRSSIVLDNMIYFDYEEKNAKSL